MRHLLLFIGLILMYSCSNTNMNAKEDQTVNLNASKKILFIGNSHTHYNQGVDYHLSKIAESYDKEVTIQASAISGYSLQNHVTNSGTLSLINSENWDYIILQENTYVAAYETEDMLISLAEFNPILESTGASIYLFKTWSYQNEPDMNALLNNAYQQGENLTGFNIVSIGNSWNTFNNNFPDTSLYADDGYHPNIKGTYLTALLFYKKLFMQQNVIDCEYNASIILEEADILKEFATTQIP